MASAKKKKTFETRTIETVSLDLSIEEAVYLRDVLRKITPYTEPWGVGLYNTLTNVVPEPEYPRSLGANLEVVEI